MSQALIVVDMQSDFMTGGKTPVVGADQLVKPINRLIKAMAKAGGLICFVRDTHPMNHISFKTSGEHCVANSSGALFARDLELFSALGQSVTLNKGTNPREDSLSAFDATDEYFNLDHFLFEKEVKEIFIVGLTLDNCVKVTALDAKEKGYIVYVVPDATKSKTSKGYLETPKILEDQNIELLSVKESLELIKSCKRLKV